MRVWRLGVVSACIAATTLRAAHADYIVDTVAGTGMMGCTGDGGAPTSARLGTVRGLAIDGNGRLLLSDNGCQSFRRVDFTANTITTVAGSGLCGFQDGALLTARFQPGAHGTFGIDLATGRVYTGDSAPLSQSNCSSQNHSVRVIDFAAGQVSTLAGDGVAGSTGDGAASTAARLDEPHATAFAAGKVYIADTRNHRIRVVDLGTGVIDNFAGTGTAGFSGDGGPASAAQLALPHGVAVDSLGNLLICDDLNARVRRVAPDSTITTIAGTGATTFNGDFIAALGANLNGCESIAVDRYDNLYVTQFGGERIIKINRQGILATIVGTGTRGDTGEGGDARLADIGGPIAIWVDASLTVYFSEYWNDKVKRLVKTNTPPTSNAGTDQGVYQGEVVALDGMGSRDPENDSLSFAWTQTSGPPVVLSSPTDPRPTFTAPSGATTLSFTLVVTDDEGLASGTDIVTVMIGGRRQDHFVWRSSDAIDLASQDTAATTSAGAQLHLRIGVGVLELPWALSPEHAAGELAANLETVAGTVAAITAVDGTLETLTEGIQGGTYALGTAPTFHTWTFAPTGPPQGPAYDVCVASTTTGEPFDLGWSSTSTPQWPGWQLGATTQTTSCFDLASVGYRGGSISLFVEDSDQQSSDTTRDRLSIDVLEVVPRVRHLALERDTDPAFSAPVQVASAELWNDPSVDDGATLSGPAALAGTTVSEVAIETRPARVDNQVTVAAGGQGEWDFAVVAPTAASTYHYRVVTTDEAGNRLAAIEGPTATLVVGGDGATCDGPLCDGNFTIGGGCAGCHSSGGGGATLPGALVFALVMLGWRRRSPR